MYGTYQDFLYDIVVSILHSLCRDVKIRRLPHMFFKDIMEFTVDRKIYWFVTTYGGALLSEWLHVACLFGCNTNLVIGKWGGLLSAAESGDIIVPSFSSANESTTREYNQTLGNRHMASADLAQDLEHKNSEQYKVWRGPNVSYQAMLAETVEDMQAWLNEAYYGVEMEVANVFAVSQHYNVWSAAALIFSDNLIQSKTVLDINYENSRQYMICNLQGSR